MKLYKSVVLLLCTSIMQIDIVSLLTKITINIDKNNEYIWMYKCTKLTIIQIVSHLSLIVIQRWQSVFLQRLAQHFSVFIHWLSVEREEALCKYELCTLFRQLALPNIDCYGMSSEMVEMTNLCIIEMIINILWRRQKRPKKLLPNRHQSDCVTFQRHVDKGSWTGSMSPDIFPLWKWLISNVGNVLVGAMFKSVNIRKVSDLSRTEVWICSQCGTTKFSYWPFSSDIAIKARI